MFVDPRDMISKTAAAHHVAGVALWPGARVLGHHGLLISHGCWDRAVKSACARFQAQRHAAWKVHQGVQLGDDEAHHRWLWHWTTSAGCVAHDYSNSLRWANLHEFGSRPTMRCMWIAVESLRNSLVQLVRNIPAWLTASLRFEDYDGAANLLDLWEHMGLTVGWCEEFAALQLRFEGGFVMVPARFRNEAEVLERLANCFMHLFDFRSWSDTRWCAVGRICRRICSGLLVGLDSLARFVLAAPIREQLLSRWL